MLWINLNIKHCVSGWVTYIYGKWEVSRNLRHHEAINAITICMKYTCLLTNIFTERVSVFLNLFNLWVVQFHLCDMPEGRWPVWICGRQTSWDRAGSVLKVEEAAHSKNVGVHISKYTASLLARYELCPSLPWELKSHVLPTIKFIFIYCDSFHQLIRLIFREETTNVLHLEHSFVRCWNLDISESRSEIPDKFVKVVPEKDGEDQLDRSCEKWSSIT